jgi:type VI secretion system secreted protein VgrG
MGKYTQARQPFAVTTPLGPDALLLERFAGVEEVSQLFRFELDMLAESGTSIPFDQVLGQKITVTIQLADGSPRYFSGIVSRLSQGRHVWSPAGDEFIRYRAEMVPALWLLSRRTQSRIFQQLSVPDILKQVLQGLDVSYQVRGHYEPRDFCVQYRETDFAFASRLMEEEGICYFFEHSQDGHKLVLTDSPSGHPDVHAANVTYDDVEGGKRSDDRVFAWEKSQEVRSGKITLWDYCFELPKQDLAATQEVQDTATVGTVTHKLKVAQNDKLELYDYPGGYAKRFDGVDPGGGDQSSKLQKVFSDNLRTAGIRMQAETVTGLSVRGESYCRQFTSGYKFNLDRHPEGKGSYVLTRVDHTATLEGSYAAQEIGQVKYQNRFQAIPPDLPFRPAQTTPKPIIAGTQTATVVGPSGQEIFLDKYGRVKVQFHWDRQGKMDANSSCWVRVGQLWAGNRWGGFFWPRVGHEVIVDFEEGDPDQPIIVGSVYNAALMPPFELPKSAMIAGIKSCSFGKDADPLDNFNGMVIYDELGKEHLQIHSETHEIYTSERTKQTRVGGTNVHVVGNFTPPGLGSGSGGGGDDSSSNNSDSSSGEKSEPPESISAFNWPGTSGFGSWGQDVKVVVGQELKTTVGLSGEFVLGSSVDVVVNPLGFIGLAGGAGALGVAGTMGEVKLICGAGNKLTYGQEITILRGDKTEIEGHPSAGAIAGALGVAALYAAAGAVQGILGLTSKEAEPYVAIGDLGISVVAGIALGILTGVEVSLGSAAALQKKTGELNALAADIGRLPLVAAPALAGTVEDRTAQLLDLTTQSIQNVRATLGLAANQAQQIATQANSATRTLSADYTLNALNMSFNSGLLPTMTAPVPPPVTTTITLNATGVNNLQGNIHATATEQITIVSGGAGATFANAAGLGNTTLNCGGTGTLILQRGNMLPSPQMIEMTAEGVTIQQTPAGVITLDAGAGAVILKAGAASITLNGETGGITISGASVVVDALEQIAMMVEENKVELAAQGVQIDGLTMQTVSQIEAKIQTIAFQQQIQGEAVNTVSLDLFS